jgi:esterase/lipase
MHLLRTRFAKDIVCEFLPPNKRGKYDRVIILCSGMPGIPDKQELMEFLARKGFWTFFPRYRGTWESDGQFLKASPDKDINDVVLGLSKKVRNIWDNKNYLLKPKEIYIIGASFGGTAAVLCSLNPKVTKAIAIAPVVDWRKDSKIEPLPLLEKLTRSMYGQAYRFNHRDWQKLEHGNFYNPVTQQAKIKNKKLLIIHAKDDKLALYQPCAKFAKETGTTIITLKTGGHLSTSIIALPRHWKIIQKFLKSN